MFEKGDTIQVETIQVKQEIKLIRGPKVQIIKEKEQMVVLLLQNGKCRQVSMKKRSCWLSKEKNLNIQFKCLLLKKKKVFSFQQNLKKQLIQKAWLIKERLVWKWLNDYFHRDLKLGNFVIGKDNKIKLIDFGIAKIIAQDAQTKAIGTMIYRAPEVYVTSEYDHSGTVWSVCFSPDGTTLASGSYDNSIRLWMLQLDHKQPNQMNLLFINIYYSPYSFYLICNLNELFIQFHFQIFMGSLSNVYVKIIKKNSLSIS